MNNLSKEELIKLGLVDMFATPKSMAELQKAYGKLSGTEAAIATQFAHMGWNACLTFLNENMRIKRPVKVKEAWQDEGNCRIYYRPVEEGFKHLLFCRQEETKGVWVWYDCVDDGCYYEPNAAQTRILFEIVDEENDETN